MPIALPLVALDVLALALLAIAVALAIVYIMRSLGSVLAGAPVVGGWLARAVNSMAQVITNAVGHLESGIDRLIGAAWHQLARYTDELWHAVENQSLALLHLAKISGTHVVGVTAFRSAIHALRTAITNTGARVGHIARDVTHLRARVKTLENDLTKGIGEDVLPRLRSLDRELHKALTKTIPGIRTIANEAEAEVTALDQYIAQHIPAAGTKEFAEAVAVALAALGLSGLSCESNPFRNNRNACGLWNDLSALLGLAALIYGALNFDDLVHQMQELEELTVDGIKEALSMV